MARRQLAAARNYWLVTSGADGRVHATPVWGLWLVDAFWFSTDPSSRKGRDLAANPEAVLHLESGDDVVMVEGVAERKSVGADLSRFVGLYQKKYGFHIDAHNPSYGIYRIKPRIAYAWFEKNFANSATRWFF